MKNYYEILEVNEHASNEVIEKAYKVLVKKYHPDLYSGEERIRAEQKIRDINEAYKILTDNFMRGQYDTELEKLKEESIKERFNFVKQNRKEKAIEENIVEKKNNRSIKLNKKSSLGGVIDLIQELFKAKPKKIDFRNITKTDLTALGLTIVALIVIGIILWFIPITNGWMRELTVDNPLFSWIGK